MPVKASSVLATTVLLCVVIAFVYRIFRAPAIMDNIDSHNSAALKQSAEPQHVWAYHTNFKWPSGKNAYYVLDEYPEYAVVHCHFYEHPIGSLDSRLHNVLGQVRDDFQVAYKSDTLKRLDRKGACVQYHPTWVAIVLTSSEVAEVDSNQEKVSSESRETESYGDGFVYDAQRLFDGQVSIDRVAMLGWHCDGPAVEKRVEHEVDDGGAFLKISYPFLGEHKRMLMNRAEGAASRKSEK